MREVNEQFWRDPPWRGVGGKHRLGLRPVDPDDWFVTPRASVLARKRQLLDDRYADVVAADDAADDAAELLRSLPGPAATEDYPDVIANAAACRDEDLCLLDVQDEQRLVAGCVCAPSYWRLRDKVGLPLWDVHAPVDGMNAKIGLNVQRFVNRMPLEQPFGRRNWFLHGDDEPFHLVPEGSLDAPVARWFVRSERQTLCKLSERFLLFTIEVLCEPLQDVERFPRAALDLRAALGEMDADEIAHFGGVEKHRRLTEYVALLA